jgi:hypothetical protein
VNIFIWIIIKNYWCDIKSENILMLISIKKYEKVKKEKEKEKRHEQYLALLCNVPVLVKQGL